MSLHIGSMASTTAGALPRPIEITNRSVSVSFSRNAQIKNEENNSWRKNMHTDMNVGLKFMRRLPNLKETFKLSMYLYMAPFCLI